MKTEKNDKTKNDIKDNTPTKPKPKRTKLASRKLTAEVFTDGACSGNPGPGGWGAIVRIDGKDKEVSGGEAHTTNNRMELVAVIEALKAIKQPSEITLTTDSKYVKDGISSWIKKWKLNGWKTSDRKPVKNQDLWMELDKLNEKHRVHWRWIKGHDGHTENERCDQLARKQIRGY